MTTTARPVVSKVDVKKDIKSATARKSAAAKKATAKKTTASVVQKPLVLENQLKTLPKTTINLRETLAKATVKKAAKKGAGITVATKTVKGRTTVKVEGASTKQVKKLVTKAIAKTAAAKKSKVAAPAKPNVVTQLFSVVDKLQKAADIRPPTKAQKALLDAFVRDVEATEGVVISLRVIHGSGKDKLYTSLYSATFGTKPLKGQPATVKRLKARLAEVLNLSRVEVSVLGRGGWVAKDGLSLSKVRGV